MKKTLLLPLTLCSGAALSGELEDHYRELALLQAINPTVMEAALDYNALHVEKCGQVAGSPLDITHSEGFKALLADYMRDPAAIADRLEAAPCSVAEGE